MNSSSFSPIFISFLLLLSSATAFNITKILEDQSDFSTFNSLLSQTHLAAEINKRQTITILAVDNGAISAISGSSPDVQKNVLSVHVILDYYDMQKLHKLSKKSTLLTTLFQSSGLATNQQGFINITNDKSSGQIRMGSAVPGSGLNANVMKKIAAQPYNISVLQVSSIIFPTGIDNPNNTQPKTPATPPAPTPKKAPAPSKASAPASDSPADAPESDGPTAETPEAETPESDGPTSDSPSSSPPLPVSDGPESDASSPDADGPSADSSDGSVIRVAVGVIVGMVCMAVL
ncbi:fasciclin-like arabinogalactan protein 14 [Magnolia sinica]|uniref:fasciclin-like arabinogalactan protein 14 n=1 Tax=Magnolia sinica TaxID=86752 RepID=UPI0026598571|nr:fasciclin-like arabinogalactan protein 14 [Magnolia sinica]